MRLRLVPFRPEHLRQLRPRSFEAEEMRLLGDAEARAREYLRLGPAFTGLLGDDILACAGLLVLWPGVAEAWCVTTARVNERPLSFHRAISRGLRWLVADLGLRRVQTAVHQEHVLSQLWLDRLGFRFEGHMPQYGPDGATYVRLARCLS